MFVTRLKSNYVYLTLTALEKINALSNTQKVQFSLMHFNCNKAVTGHKKKRQHAFPSASHFQGQLKTPQSLSLVSFLQLVDLLLEGHCNAAFRQQVTLKPEVKYSPEIKIFIKYVQVNVSMSIP